MQSRRFMDLLSADIAELTLDRLLLGPEVGNRVLQQQHVNQGVNISIELLNIGIQILPPLVLR